MKLIKGNKIIEATEKAYRVIYKGYGYKPYVEDDEKEGSEDNGDIGEPVTGETGQIEATAYAVMKKAEISELLDAKGIEYSSRDTKDKLIELLEAGD